MANGLLAPGVIGCRGDAHRLAGRLASGRLGPGADRWRRCGQQLRQFGLVGAQFAFSSRALADDFALVVVGELAVEGHADLYLLAREAALWAGDGEAATAEGDGIGVVGAALVLQAQGGISFGLGESRAPCRIGVGGGLCEIAIVPLDEPGQEALACSMVVILFRRISCSSRSWAVSKLRSTRPFAWAEWAVIC